MDNSDEDEESGEQSDNYNFTSKVKAPPIHSNQSKRFTEIISEEDENDFSLFNGFNAFNPSSIPQRQFTALNNSNPFSLSQIFPVMEQRAEPSQTYGQTQQNSQYGMMPSYYHLQQLKYHQLQQQLSCTDDFELEEEFSKEMAQKRSRAVKPPPGFERKIE